MTEAEIRQLFLRIMSDGRGKILPIEAVRLVARIADMSPIAVLLIVARWI